MNITGIQPQIKASDIPLADLAGNSKISEKEKVAEVSRQFEAVLLRQILQETRKSSGTSAASGEKTTSAIYDEMVNNQLADCISRSGSFGVAKSLQGELAHQELPNASQTTPTPTLLHGPAAIKKSAK